MLEQFGRLAGSYVDPEALLPDPRPLQILDPAGNFREHDEYPLDLKDDDFQTLYRYLVVARSVDKEAMNLQRQGQLAVYPSHLGQEAAQVGSAFAMADQDWAFTSYREIAVAIVRGVDPVSILHFFRGTWLSHHDPYEHNFAPMTISIGTQCPHAVGFAMGAKLDGAPIVTLAYFGDGATSEGDTHEALNFAGVFQAPCVFLCQNNQYAISVPLSQQTRAPSIAHKAVGYGIPGLRCDGNDVLAAYAAAKKAVERARVGGGPTLVEAVTYRVEAHTTSDDPNRYRSEEEREYWATFDPIIRMETFLKDRELWSDEFAAAADDEARECAARVRADIYDAPHGDPLELFDHVYVDPPHDYERQRAQLRAELDRKA
ncbi:MAG: pyruvate dehydrogenase (acetyl-transferring) E1 component subunit alpha [Actinomycetota bacterium]|nr:pyruvate dehydrogenase (acetyl-transferring) E1 component subunit alpha [Actinomycetota bacterium]